MTAIESSILILGAGHAGGTMASELRRQGHVGRITVVGDEIHLPYQRPPLSKAFLKGAVEPHALFLKPEAFYAEQNIDVLLGTPARDIDRTTRVVTLADGRTLSYDSLVIATGARARTLDVPGAQLDGVLHLRGIDDALAIKAALASARTLAVVGGGYIGLEVAASARALGLDVTVLEREPRLLARVASEELGAFYEAAHRQRGVEILTGTRVMAFAGNSAVQGVVLDDGREIACDVALVGVGAIALDALARASGLSCENGVVVDQDARTADPAVYAIGDVTWRPLPLDGDRHVRLESVPNAVEQARRATCHLLGKPAPAHEVPWFWSDQFDLKLQMAGMPHGCDGRVVRGSMADGKFAIFHLQGNCIRAVEAVNQAMDFIGAKPLIAAATPMDLAKLADAAIKPKDAVLAA